MKVTVEMTVIGRAKIKQDILIHDPMIRRNDDIDLEKLKNLVREFFEHSKTISPENKVCDLHISVLTDDGYIGSVFFLEGFDDPKAFGNLIMIKIPEKQVINEPKEPVSKKQDTSKMGYIPCQTCKGEGEIRKAHVARKCWRCNNTGQVFDQEKLQEDKDTLLPSEKKRRIEEESEALAFANFKSKKGR